jgi:predicted transglutaminase-like cysteine proteinase
MPLGAAATPPRAYVDFCERAPAECNVSTTELAEMRVEADRATATAAISAISYDWSAVFKAPPGGTSVRQVSASAPQPEGRAQPLTYDWSSVFGKAKAQRELAAISVNTVSGLTVTPPAAGAAPLSMSRETWALLTRVNDDVNRAIIPQDDTKTYGVSDYWAEPLEAGIRYGDCEDYVLEKRHALVAAGLPQQALSIGVVLTEKGDTHAVLVVATSTGDYVLDNRTPWILPWRQAAYRWRERQVAGSASQWALAAVGAARQSHGSFLIASAR